MFFGLRRALHVQGREEGAGAAGGARVVPGRGDADPAAHPRVEALRRRGRAAGAVLVRGPAGGAAPAHVLRAEAEAGHQDPRAAGGARGAAEVVRGAQPGVQGPAPPHALAQERLHLGPGVPVARALGADHPVPLRVEEVGLVRELPDGAAVQRGLHRCLTRCATCSSVRCAGCLVAPPSSFTGSQSLRS